MTLRKNKTDTKVLNEKFSNGDYYKLCPKCGNFSHVKEKHIYCSVCGGKLIEECPKCGIKIHNPIAEYCSNCGNYILTKQKGSKKIKKYFSYTIHKLGEFK